MLPFKSSILSFLLVGLCLCSFFTNAQEKISGIITDAETGKGISGAVIQIDSSFVFTTSNLQGYFSFNEMKQKKYILSISHIAYNQNSKEVIPGTEIDIKLYRRTYLTEEININATRAGTNSPFTFSELKKSDIEIQNTGKDIPFLLNYTPSVVSTSDAGNGIGYSGIRIRGSDATRVNVTINGIPVNDAESHQVYWVDLPDLASSTENIQVQRGIGNSTNGAGAFGGSINIQTNKLSIKPYLTLNSYAGTFNSFRNTITFGSGLLAKYFAIDGRVSQISSDGFIDRATSNLRSFYGSAGYYGSKNSLRFIALLGKEKTYQAWYGVSQEFLNTNRTYNPAGEYVDAAGNTNYYNNQTDNYRQDNYQLLYTHEFNYLLHGNLAFHYTKGKGYYEEYKPQSDYSAYGITPRNAQDTLSSTADIIRQLWLSNDFYGLTWSLNFKKEKWEITAGGAANTYDGSRFNEVIYSQIQPVQQLPLRYYSDNATKTDISAFIRASFNVTSKITAYIDLQERRVGYSFNGFNDDYLYGLQNTELYFFNPKGGIMYTLTSKIKYYASVSVGHKEPVRDDYTNSTPSKRPEPEYMIDYEMGIRYAADKFLVAVNCFYMDYKKQLILNGKINSTGEYIRESVPNSFRSGVEIVGEVRLATFIKLKANLSLSKNVIKQYTEYVDDYDGGPQISNLYSKTPIAFSPGIIAGTIAEFSIRKNLALNFGGKYVGKQFLDNTGSDARSLDDYLISDAHLAYTFLPKKIKKLTLRFSAYNLFNKKYVSNGYTYSGYVSGVRNDYNFYFPQAGLNWMGGITVEF